MTEYRAASPARSRLKDRVLLVGLALLVCVVGLGSLQLAYRYKIDQKWFFFAFFSIVFIPIVWRRYKSYTASIQVTSFFAIWMVVHGILGTIVAKSVPLIYWLPIYFVEFGIGYSIAGSLFDKINPSGKGN